MVVDQQSVPDVTPVNGYLLGYLLGYLVGHLVGGPSGVELR